MKLRQKLAVVLAASMVVTAVPVVTMASSTNKIIKGAAVLEKDKTTTSAALSVDFEQEPDGTQEFYLELENAEWLKGDDAKNGGDNAYGMSSVQLIESQGFEIVDKDTWELVRDKDTANEVVIKYSRQDDKVMKVTMSGALKEDKYTLPLPIKAKSGEVSVAITGQGSDSIITEQKLKVMTTGEKAASLTVATGDDLEAFYDDGELSKITLKESFLNSFQKDMIIKIELNDPDFEFTGSEAKVTRKYGFGSGEFDAIYDVDPDDKSTAYLHIKASDVRGTRNSLGQLEITGIRVDSDEDDLEVGKLKADIKSVKYGDLPDGVSFTGINDKTEFSELDKDYSDLEVAEIAKFDAVVEMKDSKAKDIKAGRQEDLEFTVKELVDNVISDGAKMTLTLEDLDGKDDSAFFMIPKDKKDDINYILDDDDSKNIVKSVEYVWEDDKDLKDDNKWSTDYEVYRAKAIKITFKDNQDDKKDLGKNGDRDKIKVKVPAYVPVSKQDKKTIKIVGKMRGADEFKSADAINVIDPFDVTFVETTLKVGLQDQEAGNITLKELDKAMLEKGKVIFNISKGSNLANGIAIDDKGELTVTGELKKTDFDKQNNDKEDYVELNRQSKAASTLSIDKMLISVDRTVPEGYYDLEISGPAVDKYDGTYTVEKYIKIGTANPQDLANANGLAAVTAVFTIDSTKYTVNGVEQDMDAPAYIAGSGSTMIPMRYLAYAFGVAPENILFSNGTATFFAGSRTIQLTSGSDTALVNGAPIKMAVKVENKNGRLFVPVGEVANILGVKKSWDSAAKTATFSNVNTEK